MAYTINYTNTSPVDGTQVPAGSVTVYVSENDAIITAKGPGGIAKLRADKQNSIKFITAADSPFGGATVQQGATVGDATASTTAGKFGVVPTDRSFFGSIGALAGNIKDAVHRQVNKVTSTSKDYHNWDSTDPQGVLTGGGENDNRYGPVIRAVARSLSFINKILQQQTTDDTNQAISEEEQATQSAVDEEQYAADRSVAGSPAWWYGWLVHPYKSTLTPRSLDQAIARATQKITELTAHPKKDEIIAAIKRIANQKVGGGTQTRLQQDMAMAKKE